MGSAMRFLWNATRGHRLRPWRSDYLRWRIETYSGREAKTIDDSLSFGKAEATSIPITLILLLLVFGALVAAGIPVLLAVSAVMAALALVTIGSHWLPVTSATRPCSENRSSAIRASPIVVFGGETPSLSPRTFDLEGSSVACNKRLNFGAAAPP